MVERREQNTSNKPWEAKEKKKSKYMNVESEREGETGKKRNGDRGKRGREMGPHLF